LPEEVEIREERKGYEVIPIAPIRRLEKRLEELERAGTIPQLQQLITQIIELIKGNQRIVAEIIRANAELRDELSKLPPRIEEMTEAMREFIRLIKAAGEVEVAAPAPEVMRPLQESMQKLLEETRKLVEGNAAILEAIDRLSKKIKAGTPVSALLAAYPGLRLRKREGP
jgi:methyl-accepting chemotaxis protein